MDSRILKKNGLSMLEVTVALAIVSIFLSMIIANGKIRVDRANLEKTVKEMMTIAQASLDYDNSQGNWPALPSNLAPTYMNTAVNSSPFGGNYIINGRNNTVTISTTVPSGLAKNYYQGTLLEILPGVGQDTIEITQQMPNQFSGRLEYEKEYRYQQ
jgi:prepilin-type N-terminal cleavage/methylation domain-containing protein